MKKYTILGSLLAFAVCGVAVTASAAVDSNEKLDFDGFEVFVECANGGAGELVVFTGDLHALFTTTIDGNGGVHYTYHFQPMGLSGVGAVTGDKYQATGITRGSGNTTAGSTTQFVNNFRMIGQGPGNNFLVHQTTHLTVNANGTTTAEFDKPTVDCK